LQCIENDARGREPGHKDVRKKIFILMVIQTGKGGGCDRKELVEGISLKNQLYLQEGGGKNHFLCLKKEVIVVAKEEKGFHWSKIKWGLGR